MLTLTPQPTAVAGEGTPSVTPTSQVGDGTPMLDVRLFTSDYTLHLGKNVQTWLPLEDDFDQGRVIGLIFEYTRTNGYFASNYAGLGQTGAWQILGQGFYMQGQPSPYGDTDGLAVWVLDAGHFFAAFPQYDTPSVDYDAELEAMLSYYSGDIASKQQYAWQSQWVKKGGWEFVSQDNIIDVTGGVCNLCSVTFDVHMIGYVGIGLPMYEEPNPAGFCGTVNYGQVQNPDGSIDLGVDLPQITLGPENCTTFPGLMVNLPVIGEFGIPAVSICVQALSLGVFNILGVAIDMDFLAFVMGASLILRWILRS